MKKKYILKCCTAIVMGFGVFTGLGATTSYDISTVAGTGTADYTGDGSAATSAALHSCRQACVDSSGNIYIADTANNRIRMVNATTGVISTIAGDGTADYTGDGGPAASAQINNPLWVSRDSAGNLYIAESGSHCVRMIWNAASTASYTNGYIYTIAGTGSVGSTGDGGPATSATLGNGSPGGLCVDSNRNVYIADYGNHRIRMIWNAATTESYTQGYIYTIAGTTSGFSGDGYVATDAKMSGPYGISIDGSGNLYIADSNNHRIRMFTLGGNISTIAGTTSGFSGDGDVATNAKINAPRATCIDSSGNIYIGDTGNNCIRKFTVGGNISTIAGGGGSSSATFSGAALSATLNGPRGMDVDQFGNVYFCDQQNNVIRKLLSKLIYSSTATLSGTTLADIAYVQGGGEITLAATNKVGSVEVNNGTLKVSGTETIKFNASGGAALVEITDDISNTGAYTFTTDGAVKVDDGKAAILDIAPTGTGHMSKTGTGVMRALIDMHTSLTPVDITQGTFEVSGSTGKLPTAATTVANGATLQLGTNSGVVASGAVPGALDVVSGAVIVVAAGVSAPSDVLTNPTIHSGAKISLGNGAVWAQDVNVVS